MAAQAYELGNKAEMLVSVWRREGKEGPISVELTTDLSADMVLHWGVKRKGLGDWLAPPEDIIPEGSTILSEVRAPSGRSSPEREAAGSRRARPPDGR